MQAARVAIQRSPARQSMFTCMRRAIAEVRTEESALYLIVAIDRTSTFVAKPGNSITYHKVRFDLICEANGIQHPLTKPSLT